MMSDEPTDQPHEVKAEWDTEAEVWHHRCVRCGVESIGETPPLPCDPSSERDSLGWWAIGGSEFMRALHQVAAGDSPEVVYAEFYANSDIERPGANGEDHRLEVEAFPHSRIIRRAAALMREQHNPDHPCRLMWAGLADWLDNAAGAYRYRERLIGGIPIGESADALAVANAYLEATP